jgi:hypothetical protein
MIILEIPRPTSRDLAYNALDISFLSYVTDPCIAVAFTFIIRFCSSTSGCTEGSFIFLVLWMT